jgi:2'-5' RNA ligase
VEKENLHITLRFFGETDKLTPIKEKLSELEGELTPFQVSLKGIGAFPSAQRAMVLWVGIEEGQNNLKELYSSIENKIIPLGFKEENRGFTPHITFGRIKKGKYSLPENLDLSFDSFQVNEITLFKSTLTPKGPIYEIVFKVPLGGKF